MKGASTLHNRPRTVGAVAPFRTARSPFLLLIAAAAVALAFVPTASATLRCADSSQPTCTSDADCADPSNSLGMNPKCGNAICEIYTGTCKFEAWKSPTEDPACGATFTTCAGVDSSCTKGPSGISKAVTGADWVGTCTGWEKNECVYRWCKPGQGVTAATAAPIPTTTVAEATVAAAADTTSTASKCCRVNSDCVAAPGLPTLSTCGSGAARCNTAKNRCEYDSWNSDGACGSSYFVWCAAAGGGGDSSLCSADKNPARGTGVPMGGECSLFQNKECQFWWCPLGTGGVATAKPITTTTTPKNTTPTTKPTAKPTTKPTAKPTTKPTAKPTSKPTGAPTVITNATQYTCRSPKTACTDDYDCYDIGGIIGADPACGAVRCNTVTGACNFDATNSNCREYYNRCARRDSLCYRGPLIMNYFGTCTGRDRDECEYAWCLNDIKPPPDITTTPPTTTTTTTTKAGLRTLTSIVLEFGAGSTLYVGGNKKVTAKGTYSDSPGVLDDITTKVQWRSSDETKAAFNFPGLVQAKGVGEVQITASLSSQSASKSLTIAQAQGQVECEVHELNMKALVVYRSKEIDEPTTLGSMRRALGYIGVPYDEVSIFDIGNTTIFNDTACRGNYQALFVTDSSLRFVANGLKDKNGLKHEDYARIFGVRTVYWYSYPTEYNGFDSASWPIVSTGETTMAKFTAEGKEVFSYLTTSSVEVKFSWMYKAKPLPGSIPLLLDSASPPNALALISTLGGREMLSMTFASAEYLKYSNILKYGIVNWATRGVFIGNRRIYMTAHMDDFLIDDDIWTPSTPCGTPTDKTGATWRMNRTDLEAVIAYQDRLQADPITADVRLDMVYNGVGATGKRFPLDTLTPLAKKEEAKFKWVTHGWEHLNLDFISYRNAYDEVLHNQIITRKGELGLTHYTNANMVTGQVSGLKNPDYLSAAYQLGIRFLVTDTSRKGEDPGDNLGLYNWFENRIFMIPRRANNLFYNVALREEWVAEYNCIFRSFWGRDLNVYEIIEVEADQLLVYLLRGERYPWMFHQANMRLYLAQPENKYMLLLEELLDATIGKYKSFYNLPILSPTMDDLGREVISHNEIKSHSVRGVLAPGIGLVIQSARDTTTPLTGVTIPGAKNMIYGGQEQTYVSLKGNKPLFVEKAGLYKSASALK